jgi:hypothetical protein
VVVAYDEDLANRIRDVVQDEPGLTEKRMFGGLAFLINGNMAVSASGQQPWTPAGGCAEACNRKVWWEPVLGATGGNRAERWRTASDGEYGVTSSGWTPADASEVLLGIYGSEGFNARRSCRAPTNPSYAASGEVSVLIAVIIAGAENLICAVKRRVRTRGGFRPRRSCRWM